MSIAVGLLFALVGFVLAFTVVLGLPGAWLVIALAVIIELVDGLYLPEGAPATFSFGVLVAAVGLAALGELVELLASAAGARHGGASRRGMIGSLIGAVLGGVAGTFLILIPVVGSLLGAMLGAGIGALIGEVSAAGATVRGSLKPAGGAAIGRLLGTLGKIPFAAAVWGVLVVAALA